MSVPSSSWGLPMWGGLASPMASKTQLYNSWVNGSQQGALAQAAKAKAEADAKALADAQAVSEAAANPDISGGSSFGSIEDNLILPIQSGNGLGVTSSGSQSTGPTEGNGTSAGGVGLGPMASKAVGTAASLGLGAMGMPMSGMIGNMIGQIAGDGLNGGSVFNMGLGKMLGLINPALGIPYALASMFGLDAAQGLSEMAGISKPTPGFEGGFFGKQGIGGGITPDGGTNGMAATPGGYSPDGSEAGSVGVGAQNAGADSNGGGIGGMSGAGIGGSTASQAAGGIGGMGGYSPGPSPSGSDSDSSSDGGGMKRGGLVSYNQHLVRNENALGPLSRCGC